MQILEVSMLGLRTARLVFRNPRSPVWVTLYPMVHVGEERFYREIYEDAFSHDVALVEGVRSPVVRHLTRSYRWLNFQKLGLVLQPRTPPQDAVSARIVRADLLPEEFHREWRKISLPWRAAFYLLASLVGIHRRIRGSRERLAGKMSLEDRLSSEEILSWTPEFDAVSHSILHARDKRLIECMAAELDAPISSEKRIAVVYGASHMRAVLRELAKRGFHCSDASWRTVFSI
jgi:hypothetical protein